MKKILFILLSLILTSCGSYKVMGDVTWMNDSGNICETWCGVTLQEHVNGRMVNTPFKPGGHIEFTTECGEHMVISGGMIMISGIRTVRDTSSFTPILDDDNSNYGG